MLYGVCEYPGPYSELEKGLVILYHLVCGETGQYMNRYMKYSSFYAVYQKFWIDNYKVLNKKVDEFLAKMFSSPKLRIYSALKRNPKQFKHVTLIIDGHYPKINYVNTNIKREKLYSYKLKKPGCRTQIICDMNEMILWVSKSEFCSESSDGNMFLNMKLYNKLHITDCLAMDGGYPLFLNQFYQISEEKGKSYSDDIFINPIRKDIGVDLTYHETHYNDIFGSFRSTIENQFSVLGSKFNRFNNNHKATKMHDIKHYTLQFKVACLLKNIHKFVDDFGINIQSHHKLWETKGFNFRIEEKMIDIVISNEIKVKEKTKRIEELQQKLLSMELNDDIDIIVSENEMDVDNNSSDSELDVPKEYNRNKRKRNKGKNKVTDINKFINNDKNVYEIERIVGHKVINNEYQFLIKWKDYSDNNNSWISINKFNQKGMLKKYANENQLVITLN